MPTYKPGDVVVVPFPSSDCDATTRRPALVCSSSAFNNTSQHLVLAMITTAGHEQWPGDVRIRDRAPTGLPVPSIVRWKLFTLDRSLVLRSVGALSARDRNMSKAAACGVVRLRGDALALARYSCATRLMQASIQL